MKTVSNYIETLAREKQRSEAEILSIAVEAGLRQMWRDRILGRYLRNEIGRNEAIEEVGLDYVELAERQSQAVLEDMKWALEG
ncbi:MAG: hypothetical protein AB1656_16365 [Candidatus Omnitrophota bacterium]